VMKSPFTHITDIHRWPFPHRFKTLQYLNTIRGVLLRRSVVDYFFAHYFTITNYPFIKRTNLRNLLEIQANSSRKIDAFFSKKHIPLNLHIQQISTTCPKGHHSVHDIFSIDSQVCKSRYHDILQTGRSRSRKSAIRSDIYTFFPIICYRHISAQG